MFRLNVEVLVNLSSEICLNFPFVIAAVCNQTCLNSGECLSPGNCTCRKGYVGPSCELDLDECASNLHRCHKNSVCVNMPGWYYCRCKPGYRSILHDSSHGPICHGTLLMSSARRHQRYLASGIYIYIYIYIYLMLH